MRDYNVKKLVNVGRKIGFLFVFVLVFNTCVPSVYAAREVNRQALQE